MGLAEIAKWLEGHPWRLGLLAGVPSGLAMGILVAVDHHNVADLLVSIPMGLIFGAKAAIGSGPGSTDLRHLDYRQKRAVMTAVRHGEPVADPRLDDDVVRQADFILREHQKVSVRIGPIFLVTLSILVSLFAIVDLRLGDTASALGGGGMGLFFAVVAALLPLQRRRHIENAQRARACATSGRPVGGGLPQPK